MDTRRYDARCALHHDDLLGEGPAWDGRTGRLSWVDIKACRVTTWDPSGHSPASVTLPREVSLALPCASDATVVAQVDELAILGADGLESICAIEPDNPHTRLNDACADDDGNLWVGTYSTRGVPEAGLHRVRPDGSTHQVVADMYASNGVGWSPDGELLYLTDTGRSCIDVFARARDGGLEHLRPLMEIDPSRGRPDGLAIDAEGGVWTAIWGGSALHRYTADGHLDAVVDVPVTYPTSLAFGGHHLETLFVTTSRHHLAEGADEPLAGSLLALEPAVGGLPTRRFGR